MRSEGYSTWSVCVSVCLLPRFLPLHNTKFSRATIKHDVVLCTKFSPLLLLSFVFFCRQENLDLFREALRDSEQALSDVLFHPPSSSSSASIAMTPQFIDEDLPVLPSSKPPLTPTLSSHTPHSSSSSSSLPLTAEPAAHVPFIHHSATNATTNIHRSNKHTLTLCGRLIF